MTVLNSNYEPTGNGAEKKLRTVTDVKPNGYARYTDAVTVR